MITKHPFVLLKLTCEIDIVIAPLVKWLISLKSVRTHYACQGDTNSKPYISFACSDRKSLAIILTAIEDANYPDGVGNYVTGLIKTEIATQSGHVYYRIEFSSDDWPCNALTLCNANQTAVT